MTTFRYRAVSLAAVVPFALAIAACGDDDDAATGSGDEGGNGDGTVEIASPSDGDEVDSGFELEFSSSEELGPTDTGEKHVHLYYDGSDEYEVVESTTFTVDDLDEGEHTITAALANADHSETGAQDEITVTVGGGGGGNTGDSEDEGGNTDDPYGY